MFMALAAQVPIQTAVETYALSEANEILNRLKHSKIKGAAVLIP
jgi:propanol-preferring alcohol dehydrogenase